MPPKSSYRIANSRRISFCTLAASGTTLDAIVLSAKDTNALATQLVKKGFRLLQVSGIEAFGEPVVYFGEYRARFIATPLLHEQPREICRRAQFGILCTLFR